MKATAAIAGLFAARSLGEFEDKIREQVDGPYRDHVRKLTENPSAEWARNGKWVKDARRALSRAGEYLGKMAETKTKQRLAEELENLAEELAQIELDVVDEDRR